MSRQPTRGLLLLFAAQLALVLVAGTASMATGGDSCKGSAAERNPHCADDQGQGGQGQGGQGRGGQGQGGHGQGGHGGKDNTGGPPPGNPPCGRGSASDNNPNCGGQGGQDDGGGPPCDRGNAGEKNPHCRDQEPTNTCADGQDNDGDGQTDGADAECRTGGDGAEDGNPPQCSNGVDDDGDGRTDANDPGCSSPSDNREADQGGQDQTDHRCGPADGLDLGGGGTVAEQIYHGGFEGSPLDGRLVTEPKANGRISKEFYDRSQGTPVEPLGEEAGCAISLVHEGEV